MKKGRSALLPIALFSVLIALSPRPTQRWVPSFYGWSIGVTKPIGYGLPVRFGAVLGIIDSPEGEIKAIPLEFLNFLMVSLRFLLVNSTKLSFFIAPQAPQQLGSGFYISTISLNDSDFWNNRKTFYSNKLGNFKVLVSPGKSRNRQ